MRLVLFTLTSSALPKFPFSFSSHQLGFLSSLCPIHLLFFSHRLSCIFSFVGFFCIRFCSPIGLGWLALRFFIGPASFEACCSAWCVSWPPCVITPLLHQYIRDWHGWPVISSVVVFAFFLDVNTLMHADTSAVIGLMSSVVFVSFSLPFSLYSFLCSLIHEKNCSL